DEPLGRDPARLEISRQARTDIDIDRHRQDDADEAETRGAAARVQHQEYEDGAADDAFHRQHRQLVGQRLVAHEDVAAQQERRDGACIVEPACEGATACQKGPQQRQRQARPQQQGDIEGIAEAIGDVGQDGDDRDGAGGVDGAVFALRFRHEGERKRQTETDGQQLLGIERNIENLPGHVQHPEHDANDKQTLQKIGEENGGFRRRGGELLRARERALLGRGSRRPRSRRLKRFVHGNALASIFLSLKYFKAPGWNGNSYVLLSPAAENSRRFGATAIISGLFASIASMALYTTSSGTLAWVNRMLSMV